MRELTFLPPMLKHPSMTIKKEFQKLKEETISKFIKELARQPPTEVAACP